MSNQSNDSRRNSDRFFHKFGSDLLKIAIALVIAWFGVKERVSGLEKDIAFARSEIVRLDREYQYLRSRIDGGRPTQTASGVSDVPPISR